MTFLFISCFIVRTVTGSSSLLTRFMHTASFIHSRNHIFKTFFNFPCFQTRENENENEHKNNLILLHTFISTALCSLKIYFTEERKPNNRKAKKSIARKQKKRKKESKQEKWKE